MIIAHASLGAQCYAGRMCKNLGGIDFFGGSKRVETQGDYWVQNSVLTLFLRTTQKTGRN